MGTRCEPSLLRKASRGRRSRSIDTLPSSLPSQTGARVGIVADLWHPIPPQVSSDAGHATVAGATDDRPGLRCLRQILTPRISLPSQWVRHLAVPALLFVPH